MAGLGGSGGIGGVIFDLSVDNSALVKGMNESQQAVSKAVESMGEGFAALAAPAAVATGAILATVGAITLVVDVFKSSLQTLNDWTDGIYELSVKTNLSVESLYAMKAAAEESHTSVEKISAATVLFEKNLAKARDATDPLNATFKKFGVTLNDDVTVSFSKVIKQLSEMQPGAARTALAMEVFGRSGAEVLKVIDQMGGDLERTIEKYKKFGLVLSEDSTKRLDDLGDTFRDVQLRMKGAAVQLGEGMIPELEKFVHKLDDAAAGLVKLIGGIEKLKSIGEIGLKISVSLVGAGLTLIPGIGPLLGGGIAAFDALADYGKDTLYNEPAGPKVTRNAEDYLKNKNKKGPKGPKDLDDNKLAIALAQEELKELQRIYKEETETLKDEFSKRLKDEDEYLKESIDLEREKVDVELQVLEKEREAAEKIDLPNKRTAELAKINDRELEIRHRYREAVKKIIDEVQRDEEGEAEKLAAIHRRIIAEDEEYYRKRREIYFKISELELETRKANVNNLTGFKKTQELGDIRAQEENLRFNENIDRIRQEKQSNREHAVDFEQMIAIERLLDKQLETEKRRHAAALNEISLDTQRALDREPGIGGGDNHFIARNVLGDTFTDALERTGSKAQAAKITIQGAMKGISDSVVSMDKLAGAAFDNFAKGIGSIVENYVLLGSTGPAVLKKLLAATLAHLAAEAAVNSVKMLAVGFGALATWDFVAAENAFTSAAIWASIAGVAAIAGRAISPSSKDDTSYVGQQQDSGPRIINQNSGAGAVQINIRTEPGMIVEHVVQDWRNNGQIRQITSAASNKQ